jgi:putative tryptophan/tyrosine transport system substrate-binding protein
MRRREFIAGLGGAAAWPVAAWAQQPAIPVIGYLSDGSRETRRDYLAPFLRGLAEIGYVEGRDVTIEYRWAEDRNDRLPDLAADLVRRQVAVIATPNGTAAALAAKGATESIPVVFLVGADPVQVGLVGSLNRPGGNLTGVVSLSGELGAKRLELLHEAVPAATLIAYLTNPTNPIYANAEALSVQAAAGPLGVGLLTLNASEPGEIETSYRSLIQRQAGALLISSDLFFSSALDQILALAARHRIPTMFTRREMVAAGGLMSYGLDLAEIVRQVGVYTGRILKGEKPADLPVHQSVKVVLVINLKAAKSLGLTIPLTVLAIADEVIE